VVETVVTEEYFVTVNWFTCFIDVHFVKYKSYVAAGLMLQDKMKSAYRCLPLGTRCELGTGVFLSMDIEANGRGRT
jgi:hypothetical protein